MGFDDANRKLVAILAADMVGFSRLLGIDEAGTLERLAAIRREVVDPSIQRFHGRVFKLVGDGMLAEFPSAVLALRCAIAIQHTLHERDAGTEPGAIQFRIGVHQGEVVIDGDDLLGDGVNVAARLEPLAMPGGICISGRVQEDAAGKISFEPEDLGEHRLRNIGRPVRVLRVHLPWMGDADAAAERTHVRLHPPPPRHVLLLNGTNPREIVLDAAPIIIGRAPPCDLILADREVSRQHCRVELREDAAWIVDLGSSNGTFVDGARIAEAQPLAHGSVIALGGHVVVYERRGQAEPRALATAGSTG